MATAQESAEAKAAKEQEAAAAAAAAEAKAAEEQAAAEAKAAEEAAAKAKAEPKTRAAAASKGHTVTGAAVVLRTKDKSERYLYRGAAVPDGVFTEDSIKHALSVGLIQKNK